MLGHVKSLLGSLLVVIRLCFVDHDKRKGNIFRPVEPWFLSTIIELIGYRIRVTPTTTVLIMNRYHQFCAMRKLYQLESSVPCQ